MRKKLPLLVLSLFALPIFVFSQKAYNAIYYSGKTQDIVVEFTLANGYIAGCEIKATNSKTKKVSGFLPENGYPDKNKKMKFNHYSPSDTALNNYFILDGIEESYDTTPNFFYGQYFSNGTAFTIKLKKRKAKS